MDSAHADDVCTVITSESRTTIVDLRKPDMEVRTDICLPRNTPRGDDALDVRVVLAPPPHTTPACEYHEFLESADPETRRMFDVTYTSRSLCEVDQLAVTKRMIAEGDGFYLDDFSKQATARCPESHARVVFNQRTSASLQWYRVTAHVFTASVPEPAADGADLECSAVSGTAPVGTACVPQRPMRYDASETILATGSEACGGGVCIARHLSGDTDPQCKKNCVDKHELALRAHCTCRCDAPRGSADACTCPEKFSCVPIVAGDDPNLAGSYCVRDPITDMPKDDGVATARIWTPNGDVMVDATEVSQARYAAFLGCDSAEACALHLDSDCMPSDLSPDTTGDLPATCVDWYSAKAYCEQTGKRLCKLDELRPVCISTYERIASDLAEFQPEVESTKSCVLSAFHDGDWDGGDPPAPAPVGSAPQCRGATAPYDEIYDVVGNAREWTADCSELGCVMLSADYRWGKRVNRVCPTIEDFPEGAFYAGFRCCSDVPSDE